MLFPSNVVQATYYIVCVRVCVCVCVRVCICIHCVYEYYFMLDKNVCTYIHMHECSYTYYYKINVSLVYIRM